MPKADYQKSGSSIPELPDQNLKGGEFHAEHNAYLLAEGPPNNAEPGLGSFMGVYGIIATYEIFKPCYRYRTNTCRAFLDGKQISYTGNTVKFEEANRGRSALPSVTAGPSDSSRSPAGKKDTSDNYRQRSPDRQRQRKRDLSKRSLVVKRAIEQAILLRRAIVRINAEQRRYLDITLMLGQE